MWSRTAHIEKVLSYYQNANLASKFAREEIAKAIDNMLMSDTEPLPEDNEQEERIKFKPKPIIVTERILEQLKNNGNEDTIEGPR